MAETVSAEIEPRTRAERRSPAVPPLRPWLREGALAEWLASLEDQPPAGQKPALALRWRDAQTGEDLRTYAEQADARAIAERRAADLEQRNRELEAMLRRPQ